MHSFGPCSYRSPSLVSIHLCCVVWSSARAHCSAAAQTDKIIDSRKPLRMQQRRHHRSAPRHRSRGLTRQAKLDIVDAARRYLWRTLPLVEGALYAPMMCIATHAQDIIKKATWREYDLAQLRKYDGRLPAYLTPAMAYMVLREGLIHPAVKRVRLHLLLRYNQQSSS